MTVPELVAYLRAKRGIAAEVVVERSPDGRAYGRFVVNGEPWPKETTFAIRPNGNVFNLAFFKTYHGAVEKSCDAIIYVNLSPNERRAMGYGPESPVPADNGGHSGYAGVIDALDAKLRSGSATRTLEPQPLPKKMAVAAPGFSTQVATPVRVPLQGRTASAVRDYFETENGQVRALQACRNFFGAKDWPLDDRLRLYDYAYRAFDASLPLSEVLASFRQIYDELVLPAPAGGWGVGRNASGPLWTAEKTFDGVRDVLATFPRGGSVTLPGIQTNDYKAALLRILDGIKELKPIAGYPVMTVSKFLHPCNPEVFPIYDNEVIREKVMRHFKNDFRTFCFASSLTDQVGNTAEFYVSYIFWGASLLRSAHSRFMEVFADWLGEQPGANLVQRTFDASRLYSTAFEFTIIGAYVDSMRG
jgi:hypothetical protein